MAKFERGEIAECNSTVPGRMGWRECEIRKVPGDFGCSPGVYVIFVPGHPSPLPDGSWHIVEKYLRKKRPPKDEGAREWFEALVDKMKKPETVNA